MTFSDSGSLAIHIYLYIIGFVSGWIAMAVVKHFSVKAAGLTHVVCPHCGYVNPIHNINRPCGYCGEWMRDMYNE